MQFQYFLDKVYKCHLRTHVYASPVTMGTFCSKTLLVSFLILSNVWIVDTSKFLQIYTVQILAGRA